MNMYIYEMIDGVIFFRLTMQAQHSQNANLLGFCYLTFANNSMAISTVFFIALEFSAPYDSVQ